MSDTDNKIITTHGAMAKRAMAERDSALAELAELRIAHGGAIIAQADAVTRAEKADAELAKVREENERMSNPKRKEDLLYLYRNDGLFHARVEAFARFIANERVEQLTDTLRTDLADAQDTSKSLQRENEALRKTVAQREDHLRDIATISAPYKS